MIEILGLAQSVASLVDPRIAVRALLPPDGQTGGFMLSGYEENMQTGSTLRIPRQILEDWPRQKGEMEKVIAKWLVEDVLPTLREEQP
jgi:hypothetical protein